MADALDSKSSGLRAVWVQLPPPVLELTETWPCLRESQRRFVKGLGLSCLNGKSIADVEQWEMLPRYPVSEVTAR